MKRGIILLAVLLIGFASAVPYILFVNPTPTDDYETTSDNFEINSSITNLSALKELIFNWEETNYTFYNDSVVLMMNFENNSALGENDSFVRDLSLYENNGTVYEAIFNPTGKYGGAYDFGGKEKITVANSASLNIINNLTISLWAKRDNINIKEISAGGIHTCILTEKGDAYCWGNNNFGELGNGDTISSLTPKLVLGGNNFSSISAGFCHTCALDIAGDAYCWGYNGGGSCAYGEIGWGSLGIGNITNMNTPQRVLGGNNFSSISAGYYYTCAINITGSAFCWGQNAIGELGIGNTTNMTVPQPVLGENNFSSISSGTNHHQHTCALNTTGSAFCWGDNCNGHLGIGNITNMYMPQLVLGGHNFTSISCQSSGTCAIDITEDAYCWGRGDFGGLGTGNFSTMYTPQLVIGNLNFTFISSGEHTGCAIITNGSVYCWGENVYGELGIGNTTNMNAPQLVLGGHNFSSISSICYHTCGKTKDNEIYCWGNNIYGQLGAGFTDVVYPKPILGRYNFSLVSAGKTRTCGLNIAGDAYCWGNNDYGGLGIENTNHTSSPQLVLGGYNFSLISSGYFHNCALTKEGNIYCWGDNVYGELGIGNNTNMSIPQLVLGGYNFSLISSGVYHTCALNTTGSAFCWGYNNYGQLGLGNSSTTIYLPTPQLVLGGNNFSSITAGYQSTCALNTTGSAFCWGYNNYKQLGLGATNTTNMYTPQNISGGNNFSSISSYYYNVCALNTTGSAFCWGYNAYGELGIGNTNNYGTPQLVLGGHNFSLIKSGAYHTCGINTTGSAFCWGYNLFGELGIGNITHIYSAQLVLGELNFTSITEGYGHTCATNTIGETYCWGYNIYGQLGNGKTAVLSPNYKTIKSILIGKSIDSFLIGESFGGKVISVLNQNPTEIGNLSSDWSNILLSYNQTSDLYLDGTLVNSSAYLQIESDSSEITIGENFDGTIDEVRILNRTFSSSEVQQAYKSSLKKINSTSWEFYSIQDLDLEKTYTYSLFVRESTTFYSLLRNIIKSLSSEEEPTINSGGSLAIFKPTQKQLEEGYERILIEGQKVQIIFNQEQNIVGIEEINRVQKNVLVSFEGKNYSILEKSSEKINLNNDEHYDLEISLIKVYNTGQSEMVFKEIHEEISRENKEAITEEILNNNGEEAVNNKSKLIYYLITFIAFVLVVVIIFMKFKEKFIKIKR